ncbi:hypothetical protein D3C72_1279540 [compost metagenome]
MHEPLVVQLGERAILDLAHDGVIHCLLEGSVVLAHHAGDGFDRQHFTNDLEIGRNLGLGDVGSQDGAIHDEGVSTARLQHQEAVGVVLAHDFLEGQAISALVLAQGLHRCRAGGGHQRLAIQILDTVDA